jgi:hypothetical protein
MIRTGAIIKNKGMDVINNLLEGNAPENTGQALLDALKETEKDVISTKNKKWREVNELADEHKVTTDRSNLRLEAKNMLEKINSDPDLALFRDKSDLNLLNQLSKGNNKSDFSLKDTEYLKSELGEKAWEAKFKGEPVKAKLYVALKKAALKDINDPIEKSNIPSLKDARTEALRYHKEEYVPFSDRDIERFTREGADADQIVKFFLRTGRLTDRANLLNKLMTKLPQTKQGLLPYAYFSNAVENGVVNPNTLSSLYHNLGERQKQALFPDKNKKQSLDDYMNLVSKNKESLHPMFNPKTGHRIGGMMQMLAQVLAGTAGLAHGGVTEGALLSGLMHVLPGMAMRPAVSALTNEKLRTALVKQMLNTPKTNIPHYNMINDLSNKTGQDSRLLTLELNKYLGEQQNGQE